MCCDHRMRLLVVCIVAIVCCSSWIPSAAGVVCGNQNQYDCQNGATCSTAKQCVCSSGAWTGVNCTVATNCSATNSVAYSSTLGCLCDAHWNGTTCNTPSSYCNASNTRYVRQGSCVCLRAWTGSNCNTCNWGVGCVAPQNINPMCYSCSAYPTEDRSDIYPGLTQTHANTCNGGTSCSCPTSSFSSGTWCQTYVPCGLDHTVSSDGVSCSCASGFMGPACTWLNGYSSSNCMSLAEYRGSCHFNATSILPVSDLCTASFGPAFALLEGTADLYANFTHTYPTSCNCTRGGYGPFCQCGTSINPCLNGGICGNNSTENACLCTPGYQGYICNETSSCVASNTLYTINGQCICDLDHFGTRCQYSNDSSSTGDVGSSSSSSLLSTGDIGNSSTGSTSSSSSSSSLSTGGIVGVSIAGAVIATALIYGIYYYAYVLKTLPRFIRL